MNGNPATRAGVPPAGATHVTRVCNPAFIQLTRVQPSLEQREQVVAHGLKHLAHVRAVRAGVRERVHQPHAVLSARVPWGQTQMQTVCLVSRQGRCSGHRLGRCSKPHDVRGTTTPSVVQGQHTSPLPQRHRRLLPPVPAAESRMCSSIDTSVRAAAVYASALRTICSRKGRGGGSKVDRCKAVARMGGQ